MKDCGGKIKMAEKTLGPLLALTMMIVVSSTVLADTLLMKNGDKINSPCRYPTYEKW